MKTHQLKTWPSSFQPLLDGIKTFEIRKNDRGFSVDDVLNLLEFVPCPKCGGRGRIWDGNGGDMTECGCSFPHGVFTGRSLSMTVTHVLRNTEEWGLMDGHVIMSVKKTF